MSISFSYTTGDKITIQGTIKYGLLYNWHAVNDARNILNSGWHIPTQAEYVTLVTFLGGGSIAGGKLKEARFNYWNSPNTGATNSSLFNFRGAGTRGESSGNFIDMGIDGRAWSTTEGEFITHKILGCYYANSIGSTTSGSYNNRGTSIRCIKDSTTLSDGQSGTYVGNDGKIYRTICIGTQEYLADNLAETKYRNGDAIPEVTDADTWKALVTGGMCAYNNDWSNVMY